MKKRILASALALAMTAGMIPAAQAEEVVFSDLDGHWGKDAVVRWAERDVVHGNGAGAFLPDQALTRAELASILDNLLGLEAKAENIYADLTGNEWYADSILTCTAAGLLQGDGTRCNALSPITRQETAVLLGRVFQLEEGNTLNFQDEGQVADWARGYVSAMSEAGYIQGYEGQFQPLGETTRAAAVTMLDNMVGEVYAAPGTYSPDTQKSVVVSAAGITLKDAHIQGDLLVAPGVGEGELTLENVQVDGKILVQGGGEHSVLMNNVTVNGGIVVKKVGGTVRVVVSGKSDVSVVVLESGAIVVSRDLDAEQGLLPIVIEDALQPGDKVVLDGSFGTVTNRSDGVNISAEGSIDSLVCEADTTLTGDTKIDKVTTADGTQNELKGESVEGGLSGSKVPGVTQEQPKPSGGSSSGGSSSGGGTSPSPSPTPSTSPSPTPSISPSPTPSTSPSPTPSTSPSPTPSTSPSPTPSTSPSPTPSTSPSPTPSTSPSPTPTETPEETDLNAQAAKYEPNVTIPVDIEAGSDVTDLVVKLKDGQSLADGCTVEVQEESDPDDYLTVENGQVRLNKLAETEDGQALLTLTVGKDGKTSEPVSVTVTISAPGWQDSEQTDTRFAPGYPQAEFTPDGSSLTIKVQLAGASPESPAAVYMVVNQINSRFDSDTEAVLHGHAGERDNRIWADDAPMLWVTDEQEHTVSVHTSASSTKDTKIHFVVSQNGLTSQTPTTLVYDTRIMAQLDQSAPTLTASYINQAKDKIYLYYHGVLDESSVPDASAFTVTGATVSGVSVETSEKNDDISRVVLTLADGAEPQSVSYTVPETNPLQDTAAEPNACLAFTSRPLESATIDDPELYISTDGSYLHLILNHSINIPYGPVNAGDCTVSVTYGPDGTGETVTYSENSNWDYSNSGSAMNYYFFTDTPVTPVEGSTFNVTLNYPDGATDFADDPLTSFTRTVAGASQPLTLSSAVLSDLGLEITIDGQMRQGGSQSGCLFLLTVNGTEYRLRGTMEYERQDNYTVFRFDREQLPIYEIPAGAQMTLNYDDTVHAGDTHSTLVELSGKPMQSGEPISVTDSRS